MQNASIFCNYFLVQDFNFTIFKSDIVGRALFFKFCRIVKQNNSNININYCGEKKQCVLIKRRCKKLVNGMFFIKGQNYAIPSVLVKLFREGYESANLQSLAVESLTDCEMTK